MKLPSGWVPATLPDLLGASGLFTDGDWVESKDQDPAGDVRLIQLADVGAGAFLDRSSRFLTSAKAHQLKCSFLEPGDVLIARMPDPLGRACLFPGDAKRSVTVVDVCVFRSGHSGVEHRWLMRALNAPQMRASVQALASGTTRSRISRGNLATIGLPLPPENEQRRIVAKLESLLARSRRAREALDAIPALLERFRQSVLAAAFRGDLTRDWREQNGSSDNELQNRLEYEDEVERGAWPAAVIPSSWKWIPFDAFFENVTNSKLKLPQEQYSDAGRLPVIDQGEALVGGYTDREDLAFTGELPVVVFGDHTRCAKFVETPFVQGADGVKVLSPRKGVLPRFAWLALQAVVLPNKGYSRHYKFLAATHFPLPSLTEQVEVVRRVDALMVRHDSLAENTALAGRLNTLEASLLAKAFRGELVPQDPSDEPASVLLERIRAEREASQASTATPKRRSKKAS